MTIEPAKRTPPPSKTATPSKMTPSPASVKPVSAAQPIPRSLSSLLSATGLPADKLSASIVSSARFFSLPLKPELMTAIRRQVLAPELAAVRREALVLAAAAAESKGAALDSKGLAVYAAAIDPDSGNGRGSGGRNQHERKNSGRQNSEKGSPAGRPAEQVSAETGAESHIRLLEIMKAAFDHEIGEQDPLLEILNRLPCKNGRRWIVLPFDYEENGRNFRVSMRILLDGETPEVKYTGRINMTGQMTGHLVLDIIESERRWLFSLESARGFMAKLSVYIYPHLPAASLESFARGLPGVTGIPAERISVVNRNEYFPCETDGQNNLLRIINETV